MGDTTTNCKREGGRGGRNPRQSLIDAIPHDVFLNVALSYLDVDQLSAMRKLCTHTRRMLSPKGEHLFRLYTDLLRRPKYDIALEDLPCSPWFRRGASESVGLTLEEMGQLLQFMWALSSGNKRALKQTTRIMQHQDKVGGLTYLQGSSLLAACSFDSTVSINHPDGRWRGKSANYSGSSHKISRSGAAISNPQLHLRHTLRALTCMTSFHVPDQVQIVIAGDKDGNVCCWSSTLFGCHGANKAFESTSVLDECKCCVNLSGSTHIRSMLYLPNVSQQMLKDMSLVVVGDGDGRVFVLCIKFLSSTRETEGKTNSDARFDVSVVQNSWVHDSPVVAFQEISNGGFLSIDTGGECGVWHLDGSSKNAEASVYAATPSTKPLIHFSLASLSRIIPQGGRAVTCFAVSKNNACRPDFKSDAEGDELLTEGSKLAEHGDVHDPENSSAWQVGRSMLVVVGTRGCYGTKSKSIRELLKDHCVIGVSLSYRGASEVMWRLPVATTVTSILPLGRLVLVVAERSNEEETTVAVWDTHTLEELNRFGKVGYGAERVIRLVPGFDEEGRLNSFVAGCNSGAVLRFHNGDANVHCVSKTK